MPGQAWRKGYENMKQISTGAGLLGLGVCMLGTAFIATHRGSGEAFAQATGGERRVVSVGVHAINNALVAYRIWSDNAMDLRVLGTPNFTWPFSQNPTAWTCWGNLGLATPAPWFTADNGTSGFRPLTDVDMSGETDAGDISQVLLDFNTRSDDLPPPPIDCTINAPR
jgi:hypothetical protein